MANLEIEIDGESGGFCECCGNETCRIWGYIHDPDKTVAAYFVEWTRNNPEHSPNFDFIFGTWGNDEINDKKLSSWVLNVSPGGGSYMAIDSSERSAAKSGLVNEALTREQVIYDGDVMGLTTDLIDAVWFGDPRIEEIKGWIENDA